MLAMWILRCFEISNKTICDRHLVRNCSSFWLYPSTQTWIGLLPLCVSASMERSAGTHGVGWSGPANVSPPIYPPPPPAYQAGELSHLEEDFEHGNYETETKDQGFYPPPMQASIGQAFTRQPLPGPGMGRYWGGYRGSYPYYEYMFLSGQYPPGTYTHLSFNKEQGMDNWEDIHYERYYPAQQTWQSPSAYLCFGWVTL